MHWVNINNACQTTFRKLLVVEFSTPLFNPSLRKLVNKIEKVQRVAVKLIFSRAKELRPYSNAPYEEKLNMLGIESLETRRNKFDLSFLNDYLCGEKKFQLNLTIMSTRSRGSKEKFIQPSAKGSIRSNFFLFRTTKQYRKLPRDIQYTNPKTFKAYLSTLKTLNFKNS